MWLTGRSNRLTHTLWHSQYHLSPGCTPVSPIPAEITPAPPAAEKLPAHRPGGGEGGRRRGPGCSRNTHQLQRFNLHLLNRLVSMGIREICGLCSESVLLTIHKAQSWAGGPSEGGKELPPIPQNTQIPLFLIKEQGMR